MKYASCAAVHVITWPQVGAGTLMADAPETMADALTVFHQAVMGELLERHGYLVEAADGQVRPRILAVCIEACDISGYPHLTEGSEQNMPFTV